MKNKIKNKNQLLFHHRNDNNNDSNFNMLHFFMHMYSLVRANSYFYPAFLIYKNLFP